MTPLFPHDKEEKRQLTAVWLYFLFGGDSALFNISAIMNDSTSIELLSFKSPHKKHRQAAKRCTQSRLKIVKNEI